jgi:N-acetylmuramoyl-L-alanine amidase
VIKTIKLQTAVFWILIFAAVVIAVLFMLFSDSSNFPSVFASGKSDGPVLVIDAGHGGEDGGAVSLSGVHESELNLDVAQRMAALSGLTGIEFTMTRDSEDIEYPAELKSTSKRKKYDQKKRIELINTTRNAVLISVHQNFYPHKSPHGPQSFYTKIEGSDSLAALIQDTFIGPTRSANMPPSAFPQKTAMTR